jgi:hypothetical protein
MSELTFDGRHEVWAAQPPLLLRVGVDQLQSVQEVLLSDEAQATQAKFKRVLDQENHL